MRYSLSTKFMSLTSQHHQKTRRPFLHISNKTNQWLLALTNPLLFLAFTRLESWNNTRHPIFPVLGWGIKTLKALLMKLKSIESIIWRKIIQKVILPFVKKYLFRDPHRKLMNQLEKLLILIKVRKRKFRHYLTQLRQQGKIKFDMNLVSVLNMIKQMNFQQLLMLFQTLISQINYRLKLIIIYNIRMVKKLLIIAPK